MTNTEQIENWYIENHGTLNKVDMITDLIPKGKTVMYGESGVGKTISTIKHLNKHQIKPLLLDFDNNVKVDNIDFCFIDGVVFVNEYEKANNGIIDTNKLNKLQEEFDLLFDIALKKYQKRLNTDEIQNFKLTDKIQEYIIKSNGINSRLSEVDDEIYDLENETEIDKNNIFLIKNEVVIIDTVSRALLYFQTINNLEMFINKLINNGNSVILIAHTKRFLNKEVPDVDETFTNHCDAKLRLARTQVKTKADNWILFVEKLRGYNGKTKIEGWER